MRTGGFPEAVGFIESGESYAYEYLKTVFRNIYIVMCQIKMKK